MIWYDMIWYHRWRVWCEFIIGCRVPWDFAGPRNRAAQKYSGHKAGGFLVPTSYGCRVARCQGIDPYYTRSFFSVGVEGIDLCSCWILLDPFKLLDYVGLLPAPVSFCWPLWMLRDCSEARRFRNLPENWGAIQSLVAPKIIGPLHHPLFIMPNPLVSMRNRSPHPILYYNLRRNRFGDSSAQKHPGRLRISGQTGLSPQSMVKWA